jgi:hypothetical protein
VVNSTILIRNETRVRLKQIGRKDQTYDELINELIENARSEITRSPLSDSRQPDTSELIDTTSQTGQSTQVNKNLCDCNDCSRTATTEIEVNVGKLGIIKLNLCENCIPKFEQSIAKENQIIERG